MALHKARWYNLTPDEQALVRMVEPVKGHATPRTRRNMIRASGWSPSKFGDVQKTAARKGWPVKPTQEFVKVRGFKRPLYRLLVEADDVLWYEAFGRKYHVARTKTDRAVMAQGERENPMSVPVFDAEQRLHVANNVLRGQPTAVPLGHSTNDLTLQTANNGNKILTPKEIEEAVAVLAKQHPKFR